MASGDSETVASTDLRPLRDFREIVEELTAAYRATDPTFTVDDEIRIREKMSSLIDQFIQLHIKVAGYSPSIARYDYEGDAVMTSGGEITKNESSGAEYEIVNDRNRILEVERVLRANRSARSLVKNRTILQNKRPSSRLPAYESDEVGLADLLYLRDQSWLASFTGNARSAERLTASMPDQMLHLWMAHFRNSAPPNTNNNNNDDNDNDGDDSPTVNVLDALFQPITMIDYSPSELVLLVQTTKVMEFFRELANEQIRATYQRLQVSQRMVQVEELRHKMMLAALEETEGRYRGLLAASSLTRETRRNERDTEVQIVHSQEEEIAAELQRVEQRFRSQPPENAKRMPTESARSRNQRIRAAYYASPDYRSFLVTTYLVREKAFLEHLCNVLENRRKNQRLAGRMKNARLFSSTSNFDPYHLDSFNEYVNKRQHFLAELYALPYTRASNKV